MSTQIVVAGAVIVRGALLIAQRRGPAELAGLWELPGGKVNPGESEPDALIRELGEELGLAAGAIIVGERLGDDVVLNHATALRAYRVGLRYGEPHPREHQALRWVGATDLAHLDWVPADRSWLADLTAALSV